MNILPLLSLFSDLNPTENVWGELKRRSTNMELWIWRIWRDSVWRKWSLISYQVFSKLFRHYRRKLRAVTLGKGRCNNWVPTWNSESIYFIMRFSPHFQLFYFNDRLEFCEFFEWKIKRINNADLFSQPPLFIFTKGANISGGHCILSAQIQSNAAKLIGWRFIVQMDSDPKRNPGVWR